MSLLGAPPASPSAPSRRRRLLAAGGVALLLVMVGMLVRPPGEPPTTPKERATPELSAAEPVPPMPPAPRPTEPRDRPPEPARRRAVAPPPPARDEASPPRPALATLSVESDVPGASVFLDRVYLGETPLTVTGLEPGARRLALSAPGFDSIARDLTLEPGEQQVAVRFREVRLDARVPVTHRHGVGGCEGVLVATLDGLRYETPHRDDAFAIAFDQLDAFEVQYLEKNLRVRRRGGRTWNFTQRDAPNADALFVFHREVQAAREKLAKGYVPVS